ncbi:MAG TPA: hypothetical protein VLG69_02785 [Candidatus Andersenbacteria bacterium]|nr:hypothetical protein [Candidatus Andersenbacteria bacterium]
MEGSLMDALVGKQYELLTFENEVVKVESAGTVIQIGIKNELGKEFSWLEPQHPFRPLPLNLPKQDKWDVSFEVPNEDEMRAIFTCGEESHVLTLRCSDPTVHPKPIEVSWQ